MNRELCDAAIALAEADFVWRKIMKTPNLYALGDLTAVAAKRRDTAERYALVRERQGATENTLQRIAESPRRGEA